MNILLADDHQMVLEGTRAALSALGPDNLNVDCVNNGLDALASLRKDSYDVALIDLRLPGLDGFSLLTEVAKLTIATPIIMVSASSDPEDVQRALALGARAFVSKSQSAQEMLHAVSAVLKDQAGHTTTDDSHAVLPDLSDWAALHRITARQLEVLRAVQRGSSNSEIADQLGISLPTVKTHIAAIFDSLGAANRTEAINKARLLGLD